MKRDMDLVRKILIAIERDDGNLDYDALGYEREQVYLHIELMQEHGLVDAMIFWTRYVTNPYGNRQKGSA